MEKNIGARLERCMRDGVIGDWGTTRLRLFRIVGGRIVDEVAGPGIGMIDRPAATVLRETLARFGGAAMPDGIRLCGMVGSRNGWLDVPYRDCPADRAAWAAGAARLVLDGVPVAIMAGLACTNALGAPDVMRGEETQIFGATALEPALARGRQVVALPGTHSKWALLDEGAVIGFQTFFTGELFALLRDGSTLTRAGDDDDGEGDGFETGLARAAGGSLAGSLFEARAAQLRLGRSRGWALAFLSGLLIGREAAEALAARPVSRVTLIGDPALTARYARALGVLGIETAALDGARAAVAGLASMEGTA